MENRKIVKLFKDFNITEDTYKPNSDGVMEKQEWELYKDWHPSKFKVSNMTKGKDITPFDDNDFVWIIKRNDKIVSILSSSIFDNDEKANIFFNNLKGDDNIDGENTNL